MGLAVLVAAPVPGAARTIWLDQPVQGCPARLCSVMSMPVLGEVATMLSVAPPTALAPAWAFNRWRAARHGLVSARGQVAALRRDVLRMRGAAPSLGGTAPVVADVRGVLAGLDATDFAMPGEAVARYVIWRYFRGRALEITSVWGAVLLPVPATGVVTARTAFGLRPGDYFGVQIVRARFPYASGGHDSRLRRATYTGPARTEPAGGGTETGGLGGTVVLPDSPLTEVVMAPIPVPAALWLLCAALLVLAGQRIGMFRRGFRGLLWGK
jgi:hypothetical protein